MEYAVTLCLSFCLSISSRHMIAQGLYLIDTKIHAEIPTGTTNTIEVG